VTRGLVITVLHVIESLEIGGAERQLTAMLLRSDRRRFRHMVCALSTVSAHGGDLEHAGIPVYALGLVLPRDLLPALRRLRGLVADARPDVLHVSLYWSGVLGRFIGRLTQVPVLNSLVDTLYEPEWTLDRDLHPLKTAAVHWLDAFTARRWGTKFMAISEAIKTSAVRRLGLDPARISIVPRGLEAERFAPPDPLVVTALRRDLWGSASPAILSVGRLVAQKGYRYAIEAMAGVVEEFPTARLCIAGEGPLRAELSARIRRLQLNDHVRLLGSRGDVPALLAACDLFIFPQLYGGFGNALVEAMATGKPCIVTRYLGAKEVTAGGTVASLVPLRSSADLARAIVGLARDPRAAASLGQRAARWAWQRYDITLSTRGLEHLLASLVEAKPPAQVLTESVSGMASRHGRQEGGI